MRITEREIAGITESNGGITEHHPVGLLKVAVGIAESSGGDH